MGQRLWGTVVQTAYAWCMSFGLLGMFRTVLLLLATYELFVRCTSIDRVLNGPRTRQLRPPLVPESVDKRPAEPVNG